ncbi:hypothetical protein H0H81_008353 [Sphagnurus paluster]|uniref:ARID domain-containing protein n=1 Tax=Sphagnurus paluster TaxID=117069 RepID=A0A9P7GK63_9AGAR|nr:hypothetical protein H0H81_008353 [Sphagnurus paluster]
MADRLPQYPMMPNFNPALMQQQQAQQHQQLNQQQVQQAQQQQQQQDVHPSLSGFADQGRMWSQIQHQQQQFRSGGGDLSLQNNPQMMDLLRSQSLARVQGQQQQQQQLNSQQFGLGGQQMGNMGGGAGNQNIPQQQSFLDSNSNQPQQGNMPTGFPGTGAPNMQSPMSRNNMIQAFQASANQGDPNVARQLQLMLAQGQAQNNPTNLRLEQQRQQQSQHHQHHQAPNQSSGELFGQGMVDRRPSPAQANMQGPIGLGVPNSQQHQQQQQQRRINPAELADQAKKMRAQIQVQEQMLAQLTATRSMTPDPNFVNKMRQLSSEIKQKKEYLAKITQVFSMAMQHQQQQQQHMPQGANGPKPGTWSFNPNANAQMGHTQPQTLPQPGQSNVQPSPSNMHAQIQQGSHLIPPGISSRPPSGQPPHTQQHPGGPAPGRPFPNQMSPNLNPQFPFNISNVSSPPSIGPSGIQSTPSGNMSLPPPLEKNQFDSAYKNYCANHNIKHEPRLMNFEGREIDLYSLHTHVMQEGGWPKVHSQELWSLIGGRMGFVQFPGSDTEPPTAGPGVGQRLAEVYKAYLAEFDQVYITSVVDRRKKMQQQQAAAAQAQAMAAANGNGGPSQTQPRSVHGGHQMQMVVGYANQSVEELRRQGIQEKIIQFVEANRAQLQRMVMEQGMFRGHVQRPPEQHGMQGMSPPFHGSPIQQSSSPAVGLNPPFMPPQQQNGLLPIQGNNFMDNRQPQLPQQHPHPPNGNNAMNMSNPAFRAIRDQALAFIAKAKRDFATTNIPNMRGVDVPMEQRQEFNNLLLQLSRFVNEIDNKLAMYFVLLKSEDTINKLVAIIVTVNQQRNLLNSPTNNPRYLVGLDILRNMMSQVVSANEAISAYFSSQIRPQQGQPPLPPGGNMPLNNSTPDMSRPLVQSIPPQQLPSQPPNRPPVNLRAPPIKKQNASTPAAISTPTPPAYSASTPVASTPTPTQTASSPQAPKSPKTKAPAKPKNPPPKRRPSTASARNPPTPISHAAEQAQTPTPNGSSSTKRPREEDTFEASPGASGSSAANEPSPPKRIKTEWEGPPSDALVKKAEAVENVKTEEDASAFLEQMTELIKRVGEGQESISSDISDTLEMILKGCGTVPESSETALSSLSSLSGLGESNIPSSSSTKDEFIDFFDFSRYGAGDDDNDDDSKTPDLLPSSSANSSTNPSPESGTEADAGHHAPSSSDLLRLGNWKEIDGGESAYYQSGDWKWDSPMPTQEQPWAIFTS